MTGPLKQQWRRWFPKLKPEDVNITSPATRAYNCLAFAAGDTARWWDPAEAPANQQAYHWPEGVKRGPLVADWLNALAALGFRGYPADQSNDPSLLWVAIYGEGGVATHVARQMKSGWWASKLGDYEDIEHRSAWDLEGGIYGSVSHRVARPRTAADP